VLLDTHASMGLDAMAQVDLGRRTHRHQSQQALGVMAAQVLATAARRLGVEPAGELVRQFGVEDHAPIETPLDLTERPPVASISR
jgi:glucosyl-3-phosphoglycerate synthase